MVEAGLISSEAIDKALKHQALTQHRLGDCLFELDLISEAALLRFLAGELKTRFVSAEKLAKAKIPSDILDKVPVRLCEGQHVLPLAFDAERGLLSVVMADPLNSEAIREVRTVSGANEVFAYVALRSTLVAGIRRNYYGDTAAFDESKPPRDEVVLLSRAYEAGTSPGRAAAQSSGTLPAVPSGKWERFPSVVSSHAFTHMMAKWARLFDAVKPNGPAHSTRVARLCAATARKLGVGPLDVQAIRVAAYVHDVAQPADHHFTLQSLARRPAERTVAQSALHLPLQLFDAATVARATRLTLLHRYEAFDGSGLPAGLKGEAIYWGARILSAVDAWVDLTTRAHNVFGQTVNASDAHGYLGEEAGTLFDPAVLDALKHVTSHEALARAIAGDGRCVVICTRDDATRTDLLDALAPLHVEPYCVATLEDAADAVLEREADVLCLGLKFGVSEMSALVHWLRKRPERAALPVVVLGEPSDPKASSRLHHVGASAFLKLPIDRAEAETTLTGLLADDAEHGAPPHPIESGLHETPLRTLASWVGRDKKTGRLTLMHGSHHGVLHFEQGRIVHAVSDGLWGQPALEALLSVHDAELTFEPDALLMTPPTLNVDPTK